MHHEKDIVLEETEICNQNSRNNPYVAYLKDPYWIDWHKEGNLLVCGGVNNVKVYDKRAGDIIKVFPEIHDGNIILYSSFY